MKPAEKNQRNVNLKSVGGSAVARSQMRREDDDNSTLRSTCRTIISPNLLNAAPCRGSINIS